MNKFVFWIVAIGSFLAGCSSNQQTDRSDRPDKTRFSQKVVAEGLEEPLQLEFDEEGNIFVIERTGAVKRIMNSAGTAEELMELPIYEGAAPGLIGILLDQDFKNTRHVFLYYSAAEDEGEFMRLSRFTLAEDKLDINSEAVMLKVPWEQPDGSHIGGGMTWDEEGNLYLAVGGDTRPSEYSPIHYLGEDSTLQDAARTAGNSNDFRGAILRIKPQPDGSYSVPKGNLFEEGLKTRSEIYVMGVRNPWRLSVDSKTGYLHWGEVGPDAGEDSEEYGPKGYDELNIAQESGNFGWPFVIGDNRSYHTFDYKTNTHKDPMDPDKIINNSPLNTGLRELPPAQPALVAYPYGVSEEWPVLSSGARSVVGGPVFRSNDFSPDAPRVFPSYYEGKWIVTDYVRNWIMEVTLNERRTEVTSIEPFLPAENLSHQQPLDLEFGPNGDLYMVEYGLQGRISRIEYNAGNREPVANIQVEKNSGPVPFNLQLTAGGTVDYDGDDLRYEWQIYPESDGEIQIYKQKNPTVTLDSPGRYEAELKVIDSEGASDVASVDLVAGNERPDVQLSITEGNSSFYFPGSEIRYELDVMDNEDGSFENGDIDSEEITMVAEYLPAGITPADLQELKAKQDHGDPAPLKYLQSRELITESNCETCHAIDSEVVGPSFMEVGRKYGDDSNAVETIVESIINGSEGKWGENRMPPNGMLTDMEAEQIADYILNLGQEGPGIKEMPIEGSFSTEGRKSEGVNDRVERFFEVPHERGSYVLSGSYRDKGNADTEGLHLTEEDYKLLRYPLIAPESADIFSEEGISFTPSTNDPGFIVSGTSPYIGFSNIDLTGVNEIQVGALTRYWHWSHFTGASVELRLGSPTGRLIDGSKNQFPSDSLTAEDGPFFEEHWDDPVSIDVSGVEGSHDLYFIFKNDGADDSDALLIITGIKFNQ